MFKMRKRHIASIRAKILLYTGMIIFLLLSAVIALHTRDMYDYLIADNQKDLQRNTAKAANEIEIGNALAVNSVKSMALAQESGMFGHRSDTVRYLCAMLAANPAFYDCYTIYESNADGQDSNNLCRQGSDSTGRFNANLKRQDISGASRAELDCAGRFDRNVCKDTPDIFLANGVDMETSPYYDGVRKKFQSGDKEKYMITEPYLYEGVLMLEQTYPIVMDGKFAGITGVDRTLGFLSEFLRSLKVYETADFILISRLGSVIAATMDARLNTKGIGDTPYKAVLEYYHANRKSREVRKEKDPTDGKSYFYTGAPVPTGGWMLVMRVSEEEILRPILKAILKVVVLALLGMLLSFLLLIRVSNTIVRHIKSAVNIAEQVASGDLTARIQVASTDETGQLMASVRTMTEGLNSLVSQVQRSCIQVTTSATQIAASARQLEAGVAEQAVSTSNASTAASEISMTALELANTMGDLTEVASETAGLTDSGRNGLILMAAQIRDLVGATDSISGKLAVISDKANNITRIITAITKVADQTNLLSLNAAIEAEKAGEMGLGFAVVAREIRRLADQTAVSALDIEKMIKGMQSAVSAGVMEMDKFSESMRRGIEAIDSTGAQLEQIMVRVQKLTPRFSAVNEGMQSQSTAARQISETMGQLSEAARQTSESVSEFNQATEQLREAARALTEEVSHFKVSA